MYNTKCLCYTPLAQPGTSLLHMMCKNQNTEKHKIFTIQMFQDFIITDTISTQI